MRRALSIAVMMITLLPATEVNASGEWFLAFFDRGSAELDGRATATVERFAAFCGPAGKYRIVLVGHADATGSVGANRALSLRRVDAVRQALIGAGIPAETISIAARGEIELLVQTSDGVEEPQNRRVELFCLR